MKNTISLAAKTMGRCMSNVDVGQRKQIFWKHFKVGKSLKMDADSKFRVHSKIGRGKTLWGTEVHKPHKPSEIP